MTLSPCISFALSAFLYIAGGLLITYLIRYCVHQYAFNGMSKTAKRKTIEEQSRLRRLFMTYATKSNQTKYYSPIGTYWCLVCYFIYVIIFILIAAISCVQVFFEYVLLAEDAFNVNPIIIDIMLKAIYAMPLLSMLSFLFPLKKKS